MQKQLSIVEKAIEETINSIAIKLEDLLGTGKQNIAKMDYCASCQYLKCIELLNDMGFSTNVISIEGVRDGDGVAKYIFDKKELLTDNIINIVLDPIEGTHSGSLGGSRCLSAIAVKISNQAFRKIDDNLSCFYLASNHEQEFVNYIKIDNFFEEKKFIDILKQKKVGTLRRNESAELWKMYINEKKSVELGEDTFYLQSMLVDNIYFAGDSSLFLPFEVDYFMGRTGATESIIEAYLWLYWKGILVSGKKMKQYPLGELQYIKDRLLWANGNNTFKIADFFMDEEICNMLSYGWTEQEIRRVLGKTNWSHMYDLVYIASFTGTRDKVLKSHSNVNLEPIIRIEGDIYIDIWKKR